MNITNRRIIECTVQLYRLLFNFILFSQSKINICFCFIQIMLNKTQYNNFQVYCNYLLSTRNCFACISSTRLRILGNYINCKKSALCWFSFFFSFYVWTAHLKHLASFKGICFIRLCIRYTFNIIYIICKLYIM